MNKEYLLDTSAIFAFTDNEDGADLIEELLDKAQRRQVTLYVSLMTTMELYYVTLDEWNEKEADDLFLLVRSLSMVELPLEEKLLLVAARFKARCKISVADAWIAATAAVRNLTLIHKDPEFERLKQDISILSLPYKPKKGR